MLLGIMMGKCNGQGILPYRQQSCGIICLLVRVSVVSGMLGEFVLTPQGISKELTSTIMATEGMFCGLVGIQGCDTFERASAEVTFNFDFMRLLLVSCQSSKRAQCDIAFIAFVHRSGWVLHCTLWRVFGHPMASSRFPCSK